MYGTFYVKTITYNNNSNISAINKGSNIIVDNSVTSSSSSVSPSSIIHTANSQKGMIFNNEGYTTGIHYWECSIHCPYIDSSVFIGVSPLIPNCILSNNWYGIGLTNNRLLKVNGNEKVYGKTFNNDDVIGVLLNLYNSINITFYYL